MTQTQAELKLSRARAHMIMNAPFYATLAMTMPFVRKDEVQTMATDGKHIFYCDAFVMSEDDETIRGVVAHECAHVANLHHTRRGNRDPNDWNKACDYAIDPQLEKDGFKVAKFGFTGAGYDGWSAESIYAALQAGKQGQGQQQPQPGQGQPQAGQGTPQANPPQGGQPQPGQGQPQGASGNPSPARPGGVLDAAPASDPAALQAAELATMALVQQAANVAKAAGKGSAMGSLAAAELKRPSIDWRQVLRRYVDSAARVSQQWHRPNRRHLHAGMYLPGNVPDSMGALGIIFDVSGSTCNPKTLATFLSELQGAIDDAMPSEVVILLCDTKVKARYRYEHGDELKVKLVGGGGTNMQPAIDELRDAQAVICFTDCEFGRDPIDAGVPVLWAKYGRGGKFPAWGEGIQLPE
jgi:predicted metal-dependent peptidase